MKITLFLLFATLQSIGAFHMIGKKSFKFAIHAEKEDKLTFPKFDGPFEDIDTDMDRARDCAEHFGKCTPKEMKKLKKDLHEMRIKNLAFGSTQAPEDVFQTRLLEEELSLQLDLLREESPKPYLFPEIEEPMRELPHLKEDTEAAIKVKEGAEAHFLEEMIEDGVFESLAICTIIGLLMFAPQVLQ